MKKSWSMCVFSQCRKPFVTWKFVVFSDIPRDPTLSSSSISQPRAVLPDVARCCPMLPVWMGCARQTDFDDHWPSNAFRIAIIWLPLDQPQRQKQAWNVREPKHGHSHIEWTYNMYIHAIWDPVEISTMKRLASRPKYHQNPGPFCRKPLSSVQPFCSMY